MARTEQQRAYWKRYYEAHKEERAAKAKAWAQANRAKRVATTLKWRAAHPEKAEAIRKACYEKKKEKYLAYGKAWKAEHPERVRQWEEDRKVRLKSDPIAHERRKKNHRDSYSYRREKIIAQVNSYRERNWDKILEWSRLARNRRRARLLEAEGTFTQEQWQARYDYYGGRCAYCRCELTINEAHIDHVIPVSKGGANWPSNLVPACESCNKSKQTKLWKPSAFVQTMPRQVTKTS